MAFSVGATLILMFAMSRFPGLEIPKAYWALGFACPALISGLVSFRFVRQNERIAQMHEALRQSYRDLEVMSQTDQLTKVLSRSGFFQRADPLCAAGSGRLLLLDMDHFKAVNDRYGHEVGDQALKAAADAMRKEIGADGIVGRLGGEEFAIYLPEASEHGALQVAEQIRKNVEASNLKDPNGQAVRITASIGIAEMTARSSLADGLRMADLAMYRAKSDGRNRVFVANSNVKPFRRSKR